MPDDSSAEKPRSAEHSNGAVAHAAVAQPGRFMSKLSPSSNSGSVSLQVISEHLLEFDAPRRVQHFGESFRKLRLDRVEFLQLAPVYLAKSVNVHVLSPWCGFELSFG